MPTHLCNELLLKITSFTKLKSMFLDLGCGPGYDSIFMAENGFEVYAIDKSEEKIENLKNFIVQNKEIGSHIKTFVQDIKDFDIVSSQYSIINAFNSLQFLPKSDALSLLDKIKNGLIENGFFIFSGFTVFDPLFTTQASTDRAFWESEEMKKIFSDFKIIFYEEKEVDDPPHKNYPKPHKHGLVRMIAQKV